MSVKMDERYMTNLSSLWFQIRGVCLGAVRTTENDGVRLLKRGR